MVVAGLGGILRTQHVGFQLHLAAVAAVENLRRGVGCLAGDDAARADRRELAEQAAHHLRAVLPGRVARRDVTDFVTDDRRELCLGIEVGHDAARDVDVSARCGEGIDLGAVQQRERVLELRAVALLGQFLADIVDVVLQRGVLVHVVLGQHELVVLASQRHLFLLRHEHQVGAAGGRIGGAAGQAAGQRGHEQRGTDAGAPPAAGKQSNCVHARPRKYVIRRVPVGDSREAPEQTSFYCR